MTDTPTVDQQAAPPTSTPWVQVYGATGPAGSPLQYKGAYSATAVYNSGDIVIDPQGVVYECVIPGTTGVTPTPWQTTMVQPGIPQPVVNGQWIKGVGGAAIWSPITVPDLPVNIPQANLQGSATAGYYSRTATAGAAPSWQALVPTDLPTRLGGGLGAAPTRTQPVTDCNALTETGWYNGSSVANSPGGRGDWIFVMHMSHWNSAGGSSVPGWYTQICWTMQQNPPAKWERSCIGGTWQPWTSYTNTQRMETGFAQFGLSAGQKYDWATNFNQAFGANPTVICSAGTTAVGDVSGNTYGNQVNCGAWVYSLNTATVWFTIYNGSNGNYTIDLNWIAIGR